MEISRIVKVPLREVWKHEATDFTPWLLANASVLGEVLGMDLDLHEAEHTVGDFSLDLIGVDQASGEVVIVENQLERSDHSHLGQILTYAGGTDPVNVVWVTEAFRPEHRAALDWLNERTDEGTRFFGIEISAVSIGNSPPAPLFSVVANPNNWQKEVRSTTSATTSSQMQTYQRFWTLVLEKLQERYPGWTSAKAPSRRQWMLLPSGTSAASYGLVALRDAVRVEVYLDNLDTDINKVNFARLLAHKESIQKAFGKDLNWDELPNRRASRISVTESANFKDEADWPQIMNHLVQEVGNLRAAFDSVGGLSHLLK